MASPNGFVVCDFHFSTSVSLPTPNRNNWLRYKFCLGLSSEPVYVTMFYNGFIPHTVSATYNAISLTPNMLHIWKCAWLLGTAATFLL